MTIVLVITVCQQNQARILHQINNLNNAKTAGLIPEEVNLIPLFVFGKSASPSGFNVKNPYETLVVDVPERYTMLHRKLFAAYEYVRKNYEFDFIWKIDDDTKVNFQALNPDSLKGKDYIGRMSNSWMDAKLRVDLDFCNLHKDITFKTTAFDGINYKYATGDCYFLSPKAVDWILQQRHLLEKCDDGFTCEDRMVGYMLDEKDLVIEDIGLYNDFTIQNDLQVTNGYLTIHPISQFVFTSLIGFPVEDQIVRLEQSQSINLTKRKAYVQELENKLKQVVTDFLNSKRSIGMG